MTIYYIRTTQSDYPKMLALGVMLGVIEEREGVVSATQGGCWDYIGPIYKPTALTRFNGMAGVPIMEPLRDDQGEIFVHVNLLSPVDMEAQAQILATAHPEIAGALADQSKFFVVDVNGRAARPNNPTRIFAGDEA